jgi:hypothetical protein
MGAPDQFSSPLFWGKEKTVTPMYGLDPNARLSSQQIIYTSYAGTDITALLVVPGEQGSLVLGELQTISYSIHRENTPVRTLGHVNPIGFVKGPRTIAGSLIFTQFNQYTFYKLNNYNQLINKGIYPLADMLPPFDIVLSFMNESGSFSKMRIYGVSIIDEGTTMSVDDLMTEQTYTYMARGIQPLVSYVPSGLQNIESRTSNGEIIKFGGNNA